MNSISCDYVRGVLVDYIEEEIPTNQRYLVKQHLQSCDGCNSEFNGIKIMLGNANNSLLQDPGEEFWNQLPQRVLQEVRREQAIQKDIHRVLTLPVAESAETMTRPVDQGTVATLHTIVGSKRAYTNSLLPFFAVAATVTLVFSSLLFWSPQQASRVDSTGFQAGINANKQLVSLSHKMRPVTTASTGYGFSAQVTETRSFTVGTLLSETVSYLHGDDISGAANHIAQMLQWIQEEGMPKSLAQSLIEARNFIRFDQVNRLGSTTAGRRSLENLGDFQHAYENYLRMNDEKGLMLFKAAIWTYNIGLAALAVDNGSASQVSVPANTQTAALIKEMYRFDAPAGVLTRMQEINGLLQKQNLDRRELRVLISKIKQLRELLA